MKNAFSSRLAKICMGVSLLITVGLIGVIAQTKKACKPGDACCAKSNGKIKTAMNINTKPIACRLTSKEMQERKATVIAALKKEVIERKELPNGYSFRFAGDDKSIDQLVLFIKTERQCCGFFTFNLSITEESALLVLTGPEGTKEFVTTEIGL